MLEHAWYKIVKFCVGWIAAGAAIGAALILYWQTATWMKTAVWNGYTIGEAVWDVLGVPKPYLPDLLGLQKIIDDVFGLPAVALCIALAFAFGYIWLFADEADQRIERLQSQKARQEKLRASEAIADRASGKEEAIANIAELLEKELSGHQRSDQQEPRSRA
jgi:hypothetical protein